MNIADDLALVRNAVTTTTIMAQVGIDGEVWATVQRIAAECERLIGLEELAWKQRDEWATRCRECGEKLGYTEAERDRLKAECERLQGELAAVKENWTHPAKEQESADSRAALYKSCADSGTAMTGKWLSEAATETIIRLQGERARRIRGRWSYG